MPIPGYFFPVRRILIATALGLTFTLCPILSRAATFEVSNSGELETALATASSNSEDDTINLAAGTYTVSGGFSYTDAESSDPDYYSLTLTGAGSDSTTVTSDDSSALTINTLGDLIVSDMSFADASSQGLLVASVANLEVFDCDFSGNGDSGLVIAMGDTNINGSADVHDNTFSGNTTTDTGAGLRVGVSSSSDRTFPIVVENNTFTTNAADSHGGGAFLSNNNPDSPITVRNNIFAGNTSGNGGGGAYVVIDAINSTILVEGNTFTGNAASFGGGLVSDTNASAEMIIQKNQFGGEGSGEGNTVTGINGGGGLHLWSLDDLTVSENQFLNNTSDSYGGGAVLFFDTGVSNSGDENILYNTFKGNSGVDGGGLSINSDCDCTTSLHGNAFLGNTSSNSGGGLYGYIGLASDTTFVQNNVFAANTSPTESGGAATLIIFSGSLDFTNNTVAQNETGGGVYAHTNDGSANLEFLNNIFWRNNSEEEWDLFIYEDGVSGSAVVNNMVDHVCVYNLDLYCNADEDFTTLDDIGVIQFDNIFGKNPRFVDPNGNDAYGYRLEDNSQAIDAGFSVFYNGFFGRNDFDADDRVYNSTPDLGAFETQTDVSGDTVSYRYIKWTITERKGPDEGCADTYCVQVAQLDLLLDNKRVTWPAGSTATNPPGDDEQNPDSETPDNAIDLNRETKWLDFYFNDEGGGAGDDGDVTTGQSDLIIDTGEGNAVTFNSYRYSTANDASDRDPVSWTLYGSDDGENWDRLGTVTQDEVKVDGVDRYTSGVHYPVVFQAGDGSIAPPSAQARFDVTIDPLSSEPDLGDTVSFTITIENIGDLQSTFVDLNLEASSGLEFQSARLDDASLDCNTDGTQTTCELGTIDIAASLTVLAEFVVTAEGPLTLTATVNGSSGNTSSVTAELNANDIQSSSGCSLVVDAKSGFNLTAALSFLLPILLTRISTGKKSTYL